MFSVVMAVSGIEMGVPASTAGGGVGVDVGTTRVGSGASVGVGVGAGAQEINRNRNDRRKHTRLFIFDPFPMTRVYMVPRM